tara:strand:+ start:1373 stop:1906 length:534 start_codon:yes stop_codon:yes gene_type:complete
LDSNHLVSYYSSTRRSTGVGQLVIHKLRDKLRSIVLQNRDFEPQEIGTKPVIRKSKLLKVQYTAIREYILSHPEESNWEMAHNLKSTVPGATQKIVSRQRDAINRGEYDSNNVRTVTGSSKAGSVALAVTPSKRKKIEEGQDFITVPFETVEGHILQVQIPHSALRQVALDILRDLL